MERYQKLNLSKLPKSPGVYRFYDKNDCLLYVGKAKILKSRVSSYFQRQDERPTVNVMLSQIDRVEVTKTNSEIDALILEANIIRRENPKYNIKLRDDKSYLMLQISKTFPPKVSFIRYKDFHKNNRRNDYFGPYSSGESAKRALLELRKIFPYADCSDHKFNSQKKRQRPCLFGMINQCLAPCVKSNAEEIVKQEVRYLKMFLKGEKKRIIGQLGKKMVVAAKDHHFKEASIKRDQISALEYLNRKSVITSDITTKSGNRFFRIEAYDISNMSDELAVGSMVVFENGSKKPSDYRKFKIKTIVGQDDPAMIGEIISRRLKRDWPSPDLIIIDGGTSQLGSAQRSINQANQQIDLLSVAKGVSRRSDHLLFIDKGLEKIVKKDDNLIRLIKTVRDEAHRFAVGYLQQKKLSQFINYP